MTSRTWGDYQYKPGHRVTQEVANRRGIGFLRPKLSHRGAINFYNYPVVSQSFTRRLHSQSGNLRLSLGNASNRYLAEHSLMLNYFR